MARKTNGKVDQVVVETVETNPEAIEMTTEQAETTTNVEQTETQVEMENQQDAVADETVEVEEVDEVEETKTLLDDELDALSVIKDDLSDLDVEQLKSIIIHCEWLIEEKQRDAVEALEAEMRAIQDKLWALKGNRRPLVLEQSTRSDTKKAGRPITNPNNPSEVWGGYGMRPEWLKEMIKSAGGDRAKERELLNKIREQQAAK